MACSRLSKEFKGILENIPEEKHPIARKLIDELMFMDKTMQILKQTVEETGPVEHFKQGKQEFDRESPALKSYNCMISKYSSMYKQLADLMKNADVQPTNELLDFVNEWNKTAA